MPSQRLPYISFKVVIAVCLFVLAILLVTFHYLPSTERTVAALLTPLIAIVVAWIGYQQKVIAEHKLRLELFDKRYEIYGTARKFYQDVMISNTPSSLGLQYLFKVQEARWLFDEEIFNYLLNEFMNAGDNYYNFSKKLGDAKVPHTKKDDTELVRLRGELTHCLGELEKKIRPYMTLNFK